MMIPLPDIVSVRPSATIGDFEALVVEHGHSRIPVRRADGLDFRGFVHAKDLVRLPDETHHTIPIGIFKDLIIPINGG